MNISCGYTGFEFPKESSITFDDGVVYVSFNNDARLVLAHAIEDEFVTYKSKTKKFALRWADINRVLLIPIENGQTSLLAFELNSGDHAEIGFVTASSADLIKKRLSSKTEILDSNVE